MRAVRKISLARMISDLSNNVKSKTAIIITGPTAVGKTELAIRLAGQLDTEIISADSRQCYQEMNIGVGRPSPEELAAVPHHFIASHHIEERVNAAIFEEYALQETERILKDRDHVIICGGTGLYIRTFCEGLDEFPDVPYDATAEVDTLFELGGLKALQRAIKKEDPLYAAEGEMENPRRIMRALSFIRATDQSIREFYTDKPVERPFNIIKIQLDLPRPELYDRINRRVTHMMDQGLWEEAKSLYKHRKLQALQTVGYRELFESMDGLISQDEAVNMIRQHTRNYAKRQLTWFKKETGMKVFHPGQFEEILKYLTTV